MKFKQIFRLIERLNRKKGIQGLTTDEEELLTELMFLTKTNLYEKKSFNESLGISSDRCPTCGRVY